jgi:peptidoglycan/xylan/chitin deacetylase (PgdA/CDA1 family)
VFVLTYHSHHMAGAGYDSNDHVALEADLSVIDAAGYRVVPLTQLVDRFLALQRGDAVDASERRVVALTFDDGPEYDACDYTHPELGQQRSFLHILEAFAARSGQRDASATSFVIASPDARRMMEASTRATPGAYHLHEGALNDDWWSQAIDSGRLAIANHSWDHLHPAVPRAVHSRQVAGDFRCIDNAEDAARQIGDATRYIDQRTGGRAAPFFAYPFGQYSAYLVDEYFPGSAEDHGIHAAFTVDARPLAPTESRWALPRHSCGYNWSSPRQLAELLARG